MENSNSTLQGLKVIKVKVEGKGTICCIIDGLCYTDILIWHAAGCLNKEMVIVC
jgi:hypothetical protein